MKSPVTFRVHRHMRDIMAIFAILVCTVVFFYRSVFTGLIPAPTDTLVGLYHPFRDLLAPEYPNGKPYKNFLITDPIRQQIPWRKAVIEAYKNGSVARWDPTAFSGTPLLSNIQAGALYPLNSLFFFLPFPVAWTMLIISQMALSGVFMYVFLRRSGLIELPSVFGSVIFMLSGQSVSWLTWGTMVSSWAWLPLALAAVDGIIDAKNNKRSMIWAAVLAVSIVFSFTAGHLQIFLYASILVALYAARKLNISSGRRTWVFVIAGVTSVCMVWFQLGPILSWLVQTSRISSGSAWYADGFFIPVFHLMQFFAPDFFGNPATLNYWGTWNYGELVGYVGIAGLIFALSGIGKTTRFWVVILIGSLLLAVKSPVSTLPYMLHIPLVSSLQPTRLLFVVDFALSVLAAWGFSSFYLYKKNIPVLRAIGLVGLWCAVAFIAYVFRSYLGISTENASVMLRNLYMPSAVFVITVIAVILYPFYKGIFAGIIAAAIIFISFADLARFGWKFTPFTDKSAFFPRTSVISLLADAQKPFRILVTDDRILPPNVNTYYGIESVGGYDPLHDRRYEVFIAAMERGKPDITPPFGFERIIAPKNYASELFNLLNVKYILSFADVSDPRFRLLAVEGSTKLYENESVLPRAYLATRTIQKQSDQDIFEALYSSKFDYRTDAVSDQYIPVSASDVFPDEAAVIQSYAHDSLTVSVSARAPRLLVVGNVFNPGWHAAVDGLPAKVYRINYLFMGIVVPSGNHTVVLSYR